MVDTLLPPEASDAEDRVRFKLSDVRRMIDAGILDDEGRYEVIEGEIVAKMAPNPPHINVKRWLLNELAIQLGRSCWVDSEPTFYLELDGDYTLPDIIVYPRHLEGQEVHGPDALLVVEVADKSLKKDRGRKAKQYGRFGVRDYWVVDAKKLVTYRFTEPVDGRYSRETAHEPEETLVPALLPQVKLRLADVRSAREP